MAFFIVVGERGTWVLFKVASYIDKPDSPWVSFHLKDYRKAHRFKQLYMLTWHIHERRIADSSEWKELKKRSALMADWVKTEIETHMEIEDEIESEFA